MDRATIVKIAQQASKASFAHKAAANPARLSKAKLEVRAGIWQGLVDLAELTPLPPPVRARQRGRA